MAESGERARQRARDVTETADLDEGSGFRGEKQYLQAAGLSVDAAPGVTIVPGLIHAMDEIGRPRGAGCGHSSRAAHEVFFSGTLGADPGFSNGAMVVRVEFGWALFARIAVRARKLA